MIRSRTMREARKHEINFLVDVFIGHELSPAADAGWHGDNQIGRWIEMGIQPPPEVRYYESNAKSIHEIQFLRAEHERLKDAQAIMQSLKRHNPNWYDAIYQKRKKSEGSLYYGPNGILEEGRAYNDAIRAHEIGQTEGQFKNNLKQAYEYLDDRLQVLELRRELAA